MEAAAPGLDPLIAEAKLRMRRRRVTMAVLVLLAAAGVLYLILRPSGVPGTTRLTSHGRNGSARALTHLKVPVDAAERAWQAGIKSRTSCACGLTRNGEAQLRREVDSWAGKSGATVVRLKVWSGPGTVEVVLATRMNSREYLHHRLASLVSLFPHEYPYIKVVNATGSMLFEVPRLPHRLGPVGPV